MDSSQNEMETGELLVGEKGVVSALPEPPNPSFELTAFGAGMRVLSRYGGLSPAFFTGSDHR